MWLKTYSGIHFDPLNPNQDDIKIVDIAHALSQICRFTGHTNKFYSVADHSIRVANNMKAPNKLWGLLHDASEAYICDIARPIKYTDEFAEYRKIEKKLQQMIYMKYGLNIEDEPTSELQYADNIVLMTEGRDLCNGTDDWHNKYPYELPDIIVPLTIAEAERGFLNMFIQLQSKG